MFDRKHFFPHNILMSEPILKYLQIPIQVSNKRDLTDKITSFVIAPDSKILFGTERGRISLCTINGKPLFEYPQSSSKITSISVDPTGQFFLVSNAKGNLTLYSLNDEKKNVFSYDNDVGISQCALDPNYVFTKEVNAVIADENGSIHRINQGWLRTKKTTIAENEGYIQSLLWDNEVIAWASYKSINVIREKNEEKLYKITPLIQKSENQNPVCNFLKLSKSLLGVTFGNLYYELWLTKPREITVNIRKNILAIVVSGSTVIQLYVDSEKDKTMLYIDQNSTINIIQPPDIILKENEFLKLVSTNNNEFILALDRQIYSITFSTWAERIQALLDRNEDEICLKRFDEMLSSFSDSERIDLFLNILSYFIKTKCEYTKAAKLCYKYLKPNKVEWNQAIELFQNNGALGSLASYVPLTVMPESPKFIPILKELLQNDTQRFCQVFADLPDGSYDPMVLIQSISSDIKHKSELEIVFYIPLMILYHKANLHSDAFDFGLKANYLKLFDDIDKYQCYEYPLEKFQVLYMTYGDIFTQFLLSHTNQPRLKPNFVLQEFEKHTFLKKIPFEKNQMYQHMLNYLHQLYKNHIPIPKQYATNLAILYIKFHHPETMNYLINNSEFDYTVAQQTAIEEKLYHEAAFLSKKTGAIDVGMDIHLDFIKNPKEAVEYAIQVADEGVWNKLKERAYRDESLALLQAILDNLPSLDVDVIKFIKGIPEKSMNKTLSLSIAKAYKEFNIRKTTARLTQEIIANSAFDLFERKINSTKKGKIIRK